MDLKQKYGFERVKVVNPHNKLIKKILSKENDKAS
jgi:hypothetical protein